MTDNKISNKEFCDTLREVGVRLASGERDEVVIPRAYIDFQVEGGSKITPSYMRMTINRVPDVKAKGSVSVKMIKDEEGAVSYTIALNTNVRRKVLTNDDLPRLESQWKRKFVRHLLKTTPRITDLEGERLEGAAIAIERFIALIEEYAQEGEE